MAAVKVGGVLVGVGREGGVPGSAAGKAGEVLVGAGKRGGIPCGTITMKRFNFSISLRELVNFS